MPLDLRCSSRFAIFLLTHSCKLSLPLSLFVLRLSLTVFADILLDVSPLSFLSGSISSVLCLVLGVFVFSS